MLMQCRVQQTYYICFQRNDINIISFSLTNYSYYQYLVSFLYYFLNSYFVFFSQHLMSTKIQLDGLEREPTYIEPINSKHWTTGQYGQKKSRKKKLLNRLNTQNTKISAYSSSSKLTSFLKGQSIAQADNFRESESTYFNQLAEKYVRRGSSPQKIKQQMELALQRKNSEIQALRVHRDQLKFISYNNPYDMPIKLSLAVLKQKAKTEQKVKDMIHCLQKDIRQIEFQFNTMTDYYNFITNALKSNGEEDLIIDTHEEEKLMVENLQKETNHLFKELKEEDKKNAKEIRNMQDQISLLRVSIKQKQDKIRDLKSMICTLHIKLHSRGSNSKEKSMSLSIRKFITEQNNSIQQAFIGNNSFKHYSKQILQKVNADQELVKIIFNYQPKKQLITFRCVYKHSQGKLHTLFDDPPYLIPQNYENITNPSPTKPKKQSGQISTQIRLKYLLSMKFYFKSKIVGIQCRTKSQKGTQHIQIGNCSANLQHQLLTLINKKIVTLGSYWHQKDMIGVGVWYCSKAGTSRNTSTSSKDSRRLRNAKSIQNLNAEKKQKINEQYYIQ